MKAPQAISATRENAEKKRVGARNEAESGVFLHTFEGCRGTLCEKSDVWAAFCLKQAFFIVR